MALITKPYSFGQPMKPKYMRWKKWRKTKEYKESVVTPEKINEYVNKVTINA